MDGEADDFTISDEGELVPVASVEWSPRLTVKQQIRAFVTVQQSTSDQLVVQVYGYPTADLMETLMSVFSNVTDVAQVH